METFNISLGVFPDLVTPVKRQFDESAPRLSVESFIHPNDIPRNTTFLETDCLVMPFENRDCNPADLHDRIRNANPDFPVVVATPNDEGDLLTSILTDEHSEYVYTPDCTDLPMPVISLRICQVVSS